MVPRGGGGGHSTSWASMLAARGKRLGKLVFLKLPRRTLQDLEREPGRCRWTILLWLAVSTFDQKDPPRTVCGCIAYSCIAFLHCPSQ
jgi:hypothetical protein